VNHKNTQEGIGFLRQLCGMVANKEALNGLVFFPILRNLIAHHSWWSSLFFSKGFWN